ncbi:RNA polymerase sigma factor [Sanyastnella coralliicola]|uniref:RNA polymerase sigma factor n=1 Tax=Sanyastnella coralliicola TaxID=3069118 RepID=UPI0027BAEB0D|nr:RNA polymerase sigma factor [Longitalea sp. SCSIO 12813]
MRLFRTPYTELTDEQLMEKAARHDERAFSTLYDRYSDQLLHYFWRMLWKDREMAEDFLQELFIKVAHNAANFDGKRAFKTWLFSIANNMCKNAYRHAEVKSRAKEVLENEKEHVEKSRSEKDLDHATFHDQLEKALQKLDTDKQSTFRLRYFDEMSIKEISEALECSEGTVKSRLFYTLKHLNQALKGFEHLLKE